MLVQLCAKEGLPMSSLNVHPVVDVAIDGADEVDGALHCIKGGGGCHLREKLVAAYARQFVVIADSRKQSKCLGTVWRRGVPVEVLPCAALPCCFDALEGLAFRTLGTLCDRVIVIA